MQKVLKTYQKRLTNLTGNNRSLLLLKLNQRQFIDLHQLDFLVNKPSFHIIENLIAGKKKTVLGSNIDSRDKNANAAASILNKVRRTDRFIQEERGAKDLYVGYPFVQGKMQDDTLVRCPLLFFPVELELQQNQWILKPRADEEIGFNKTFLLAYSHYNNATFEEQFLDQNFEDFSRESQVFLTGLYRLIEESPLEINFNRENFTAQLHDFKTFTKTDFEQSQRTGELRLMPEAVLGVFPLSDSYLMPDYNFLLSQPEIYDLDDFFKNAVKVQSEGQISGEQQTTVPYPLDASQEYALKTIKNGQSIVVQGPPGTGKSQLICNLISDYIARGKRVLLVCQKRAALDVVHQRLREKDIHPFAALVHDFQNDRKNIYGQINQHIEDIEDYQKLNNSFDNLHVETRFDKLSRDIDELTEQLETFKTALFDTQQGGISVKELYLTSDRQQPYISLEGLYEHFHFNESHHFKRKLIPYLQYREKLGADHLWQNRVSFAAFQLPDVKKIAHTLEAVPLEKMRFDTALQSLLHRTMPPEEISVFLALRPVAEQLFKLLTDEKVFHYFGKVLSYKNTDLQWLTDIEKQVMQCFENQSIEISLENEELEQYAAFTENYLSAKDQFFKKLQWNWFSGEKKRLAQAMSLNGLSLDTPGDAEKMLAKIRSRQQLEKLRTRLLVTDWLMELSPGQMIAGVDAKSWLEEVPVTLEGADFDRWFGQYTNALLAKQQWTDLQVFFSEIPLQEIISASAEHFKNRIGHVFAEAMQLAETIKTWQIYLSDSQINKIWQQPEQIAPLQKVLQRDFDWLCEADALSAILSEPEKEMIQKLLAAGDGSEVAVTNLFENSLRLAWIEHIEARYPVLRAVSSLKLEQLEKDLQRAVAEKSAISREMLLMRVRKQTYSQLAFNRLNNLVSYRDLKHQVTKKRYIYPLRKLLSLFADEIFNLIPCWMASPESVSAIFPMQELFDLVIFDEASQCFAEKGIPAMYRGRQVVIVGDDKQLAPSDLYRPRWEEEMDDAPELEVDSLLDLGNQHLQNVQLTGHYRSQSLDLIDFSNHHFYNNKLKLIPDYHSFIRQDPAIQYLKVAGTWEKNTNLAEAEKVVQLVRELIGQGKTDIGVITFNAPQQMLIQDLLEASGMNLPESLFVKNIENVQGDERDIIIFSVGYAPTPTGRMNMQFGSLSQAKGENRLNVAVTRAREKIWMVSSIVPSQLRVEETAGEGPKLLKAYLQYALDVSEGRYRPSLPGQKKYNIDWFLKKKLAAAFPGQLAEDLPFADLSLYRAGELQSLLLTDDNLYHDSISAKEAHVYLPFILQKKHWRFTRVYSRAYWMSKEEVEEKVKNCKI